MLSRICCAQRILASNSMPSLNRRLIRLNSLVILQRLQTFVRSKLNFRHLAVSNKLLIG